MIAKTDFIAIKKVDWYRRNNSPDRTITIATEKYPFLKKYC